ncbi:MAG: ribose 5-phosphate isomerase B [Oscillospiraceae bacterium]|nr:ribose 5-phosphate isomerase B [Oscillospiraceae bacterium]MCL2248315.1 ribose 5-phosphate isomerase B [Oscillospiraceae bacterium]
MIALACDHGGFMLKQDIIKHLDAVGLEFKDFGTYTEDSCDYPVFAVLASKAIVSGECERGIFICGTGIGVSLAANKVPGIRAAVCTNTYMAEKTRAHNDANVLALGARVVDTPLALDIVKTFLNTEFSGDERHARRVDMLKYLDSQLFGQ